jgi:hypothetical protein
VIDHLAHATIARWTGGLSPAALTLAQLDWQLHLAISPGKQLTLTRDTIHDAMQFFETLAHPHPVYRTWSLIAPAANDRRFSERDWELPAFNMLAQAFLLTERWWQSAATDVRGVARQDAAIADFAIRQCLDVLAPTNFALSNPEVLRKIMETGGGNFVGGLHNCLEDWKALVTDAALQRPDLVTDDPRLSDRRAAAAQRSDGVECGRDPYALSDAFRVSPSVLPRQRSRRGALSRRRASRSRYPICMRRCSSSARFAIMWLPGSRPSKFISSRTPTRPSCSRTVDTMPASSRLPTSRGIRIRS